jgi:hypothetical protein
VIETYGHLSFLNHFLKIHIHEVLTKSRVCQRVAPEQTTRKTRDHGKTIRGNTEADGSGKLRLRTRIAPDQTGSKK